MRLAEDSKARGKVHPQRSTTQGIVVPNQAKWSQRLVAGLVFRLEQMLIASLRIQWRDESGMFDGPVAQPVIFCIWHNRLALSMAIFRKRIKRMQPERRLAALVSASKDGALLAAILERFGVQPVRGSTSRRGPQALLELTTWAERGYDLAITPDGPRGPRYVVQEGALALAQLTGAPIVPVTYNADRKMQLESWDRFQIPLPLARCEIIFRKPILIGREVSDEERQVLRSTLEKTLRESSLD